MDKQESNALIFGTIAIFLFFIFSIGYAVGRSVERDTDIQLKKYCIDNGGIYAKLNRICIIDKEYFRSIKSIEFYKLTGKTKW